MKCPNCREEVLERYIYCPTCGYNIKKLLNDKDLSFTHALKLITEKNYSEAVAFLKIASRLGNANAMYEYGKLYIAGQGVIPNNEYVIYCMTKAAELGNEEAVLFLINSYINGKYGLQQDKNKAKELFLKLSETTKKQHSELIDVLNLNTDNTDAEETKSIGEIIDIKGSLNIIEFDDIVLPSINESKKDPFEEEKINLNTFYKKMDELIEKYKSGVQVESEFFFDDIDQWENEMYKREGNHRIVQNLDYIQSIIPNPYIGRMDVLFHNEETPDTVYVGKEPVWDANSNLLVSSWYSPIGNKIYDDVHTTWAINGKKVFLKLKRNITIKNKALLEVYETFNDSNNATENKIISDTYLLKILEKKRVEGRISDIVSSIQYYQNQIITSPFSKSLIMQGCAGCGKTMILFHRLKYLLGNNIRNNSNICIITPNERFNDFIAPLIYDLRLRNINMFSITKYYIAILNSYQRTPKGTETLIKFPDLFQSNYNTTKPIVIEDDGLLPEEVVNYYYSNEFFENVSLLKKITIHPLSRIKTAKEYTPKDYSQIDLLNILLGLQEKSILPKYVRKKGAIHKCELFALCLLYYKRCGEYRYQEDEYKMTERNRIQYFDFKYNMFFIDEAQDLSVAEYRFINAINGNRTYFNLFGDVDQTISSYGIRTWNELSNHLGDFNYYDFNKNYRNTSEIIEYVNKKLNKKMENVGYNGYGVIEIPLYNLQRYYENDSVFRKAILCAETIKNHLKQQYPMIADRIFSTKEIKGMEFDSVYVLPKLMTSNEKYIAMTRALEKLVIIQD